MCSLGVSQWFERNSSRYFEVTSSVASFLLWSSVNSPTQLACLNSVFWLYRPLGLQTLLDSTVHARPTGKCPRGKSHVHTDLSRYESLLIRCQLLFCFCLLLVTLQHLQTAFFYKSPEFIILIYQEEWSDIIHYAVNKPLKVSCLFLLICLLVPLAPASLTKPFSSS